MAKSFFGKALKVTFGVAAAAGAVAAAGIVYGLKKWSADDDSEEIKITTGCKNGLHIKKTEDGKYLVDTKYDWASDPNFCDDETEEAENGGDGIVIDISNGKCCENGHCDCEEHAAEAEEKPADVPCECEKDETSKEDEETGK